MSTNNPYTVLDPEQAAKLKAEKAEHQEKNPEPPKQHHVPKPHDSPKKPFEGHKNPANPKNDEELKTEKESVAHHKHPHEGVKQKGVSAEPHPMDRKSGTGRGKEVSKGGAGRHAWGTVQDELKREGQYDDVDEEYDESNLKEQEKLPADVITLEEYQHKAATEGKDAPKDHPVLGSHSQSLGFKTEDEKEKEIKKAEESHPHQEKIEIVEKDFPKLG